ncbi:MAG: hypothetical protein ACTHXA_06175 [Gulosibacter sp.]|uniref:hypothetical protein n=1 Tax=Gulosibacter sp. TaxID=2817531 RepID=UPI003F92D627
MTPRDKNAAKIKPGDGSALKPVRGWDALWRSQFAIRLMEPDESGSELPRTYAVDVNFFDWETSAALYRDGRQHLRATLPVRFPVYNGEIDVADSTFGMRRVHLIRGKQERQLVPTPGTAEHWRAQFGRNHPILSRTIGILAVVVLLIGLAVLAPQILEWITSIEMIADRFGRFESPIQLPPWLATCLTVAGLLAAFERALTLRSHWLIDADTWWMGD